MRIIDTHLHLDNSYKIAETALSKLNIDLKKNKVTKYFLIHMDDSKWDYKHFSKITKEFKNIITVININPNERSYFSKFKNAFEKYNFKILKLHPRLYNFKLNSKKVFKLLDYCQDKKIPVLIDAFPDGISIYRNLKPSDYFVLAKKYKKIKFIWAHMGGHQILDFVLLAKRLPNVFFDISYSFLYFRDSSIEKDFFYCFKNLKFKNIFYGSDFPDRSVYLTIKLTKKLFKKYKLSLEEQNKLMYLNAEKFIKDEKL